MPERLSTPEDESGPEVEANMLVTLNEAIEDAFQWAKRRTEHYPPDFAPDALAMYCGAVAKRDPSFGRLLVRKLVERSNIDSGPDIPHSGAVEQHLELARNINADLIEAGHVQPGWLHEEWARDGVPFPEIDLDG